MVRSESPAYLNNAPPLEDSAKLIYLAYRSFVILRDLIISAMGSMVHLYVTVSFTKRMVMRAYAIQVKISF